MADIMFQAAENQANRCRALAHPRRILIIWNLSKGEKTVGEIARRIESSIQNTSHHLRLMKEKGILKSTRKGQSIYYQIADPESVRSILQMAPSPSQRALLSE